MPDSPFVAFLNALRDGPVLTPEQRAELSSLAGAFPNVPALARELVRRGWLTTFQANQIARGRAAELAIGPYLLLDRLGEGGMGQVFKARQALLDRAVAVKVLRPGLADEPRADARFLKEVRAVGRLAHPHIVVAHDAARDGARLFLVMEYVDGTDLSRYVRQRGPLPAAEACEYVRQAALGLQHAYEAGLVHRDIKPGNLLLHLPSDGQPVVKVADLGLALLRARPTPGSLTGAGAVMGTPDYMAPEQAADADRVDIRADIYSLGCTLYHLLSGRPPFADGSLTQKLMNHATAEPAPLVGLPSGLDAVVRRMMAKRPADRYPPPAAVAQALAPFAKGAPVPADAALTAGDAPTVDDPRRVVRGMFRRWMLLPLLAVPAVLVLLVCLGGARSLVHALFDQTPASADPPVVGATPPATQVTVTVVLRGLPPDPGPGAVLLLDGREATREELERPINLAPGKHTLKLARGGALVEVRVFEVGPDDRERPVVLVPQEKGGPAGLLHTCKTQPIHATALTFSTDGRRVVAGGIGGGGSVSSPILFTWDAATGEQLRRRNHSYGQWTGLSAAPDGRRLFFQHLPSWAMIHGDVEGGSRNVLGHYEGPGQGLLGSTLSADGRLALAWTNKGRTWVWDLTAVNPDLKQRLPPLHKLTGSPACFTADSRRAITVDFDALVVWDLATGKEVRRFGGLSGRALCVAVSADDRWVATGATDTTLRLWDLEAGKERHHLRGHDGEVPAVAFSFDGRRLVTGGADGTVRLWDVANGAELHRFDGPKGRVFSVAFSPGGKRVASSHKDLTVRIWQLPD